MAISYKLEHFEGPLDLLLHLIEKNKVSIYDIPIVLITEQYLEYVSSMETEDLNVVSEFLVMAATLIDIKCRMLLPVEVNEDGEEEDPRAELMARLLEYKMYKYMAQELQELEDHAGKHLYKVPTIPKEVVKYEEPVDLDQLLDGLTLAKLQSIFESIMKRQENKIDPMQIWNHPQGTSQPGAEGRLRHGLCQKEPEVQLPSAAGAPGGQAGSGGNVSGSAGIDEDGKDSSDTGAFV